MVLEVMLTAVLLSQSPPSPAPPSSPPPARRGFQGALAVQRAEARGDLARDVPHRDFLPSATEVEAHLGWKLTDRVFAGIYVGAGLATAGDETRDLCDWADLHCGGSSRRAGLMVKLDLQPSRAWNPWFAVGSGVERHDVDRAFRVRTSQDPDAPTEVLRAKVKLRGLEPLRLMAGLDFRATRALGLGVHAALSLGRYRDVKVTADPSSTVRPANLAENARASHTWITFGVHGALFP